ncbi:MAG: hypothetical protein RIE08_15060 [Acidimicrobiales bacterium]
MVEMNGPPLRLHVVGRDEPTLALVGALRTTGPAHVTIAGDVADPGLDGVTVVPPTRPPADPDIVLIGIDEAATFDTAHVWAPAGRDCLTVVAPPGAPDRSALAGLGVHRYALAASALYAPALGRLLVESDAIARPHRVAVAVALPDATAAAAVEVHCVASAIALALTVATPARPVAVQRRPEGTRAGRITFDDGTVAEFTGARGRGSHTEVQVAGADGTARLELAAGYGLERNGEPVEIPQADAPRRTGFVDLAIAMRAAALGRREPPLRAGSAFAAEILDILDELGD